MATLPRFQPGVALTRLALAGLFLTAPRPFVHIETHGLDRDAGAPRTIYAITHRRDPDSFIAPAILLTHRGWDGLTRDVRFIMRADAFQSGFLARLLERPEWLRRAIRPISVSAVLRAAGVFPIEGFHSRPAELWVRDALAAEGLMPAGELLAEAALRAVAEDAGEAPGALAALDARNLRKWRYARALQLPTGPGVLSERERRPAERRLIEVARGQLRAMANWLAAGGSLFLAPEGQFSPDGLLGPARAGLRLLTRGAPPGTRVQPVAITYDAMTSGRLRMWIDLAGPLVDVAGMEEGELERQLREAWLTTERLACAQLATAALVMAYAATPGAPVVTSVDDLGGRAYRLSRALDAAGRHVDSALLSEKGARQRVARYLGYLTRHGLASRHGATWTIAPGALPDRADAPAALPGVPPGGVGYERYPLRYAWNEAFEALQTLGEASPLASAASAIDWPSPRSADAGR